jgi:hypothetical protein
LSVDFTIPWDAVATIRAKTRGSASGRTIQFDDAGVLSVTVMSQTNVDVVLRQPTVIPLRAEPIAELRCYADDPAAFVARAQRHLTDRAMP